MQEPSETPFSEAHSVSRRRLILGYVVMLGTAIGMFTLVRVYGESFSQVHPAAAPVAATHAAPATDTFLHVLLALVVIVVLSRGLGRVFAWLGQPRVIGEVVVGIDLGPSLLGRVAPAAMAFILPPAIAPSLGVISPVLFAMLVLMALITTLATTPVLQLLRPARCGSTQAPVP